MLATSKSPLCMMMSTGNAAPFCGATERKVTQHFCFLTVNKGIWQILGSYLKVHMLGTNNTCTKQMSLQMCLNEKLANLLV